ncbi:peptidase family m48 domain-containing protein [Ditylenchus destructor]|nr:peptidase family m48 domain-containing protein [Ditylenchus destructor]
MILSIFAHEIAHWNFNHLWWKLFVDGVDKLLLVLLFAALWKHKPLYTAFGFKSQPILVGAIIILYMVAGPYDFFKTFLINRISQTLELQADYYTTTVGLGSEFCLALLKSNKGVSSLESRLFSLYRNDHPPPYERLKALNCSGI